MQQLQERLGRLRAGHPPSPADLDRARAFAEAQKVATEQALHRLASARATAEIRHRQREFVIHAARSPARSSTDLPPTLTEPTPAPAPRNRLRDAVVALCLQPVPDGDPAIQQRRRALARRVTALATDEPAMSWPEAVCAAASELPGIRGAAISTYDRFGVPHPLTATDDWTRQAEELQQVLGEGPGATAHRHRQPVMVARLTEEVERWPGYVDGASVIGVEALWALPLPLGPTSVGSITLHRDGTRPGAWLWQDACTVALLATSALTLDVDELERGIDTRCIADEVVNLAAGMTALHLGVPVDQALDRMRAYAFGSSARISEIAQAIVEQRLTLA